LIAAVRLVASGDVLLAPSRTRDVIESHLRKDPESARLASALTARETEVLKLVARGLSNKEIGETLHVSEATVRTHIGHLLSKLQLTSRVQAVVLAYESGLVTPRES
jgi:DNA-binding NarL/FixJ family response regulator